MDVLNLEPHVFEVLGQLGRTFAREGIPYALIGASALLLRGVRLERSTRDLDFVVAVEPSRRGIHESVVEAGLVPSRRVSHRFSHPNLRVEVDVLPLDPVAISTGRIEFPEGGSIPSTGLSEAIRSASPVSVGPTQVRVAEVPILVALKLVAAAGRPGDRDLGDALAAMEQNESEGDRRYTQVDYLVHPGLRFETAGAFLLARDLRQLLYPSTVVQIGDVIARLLTDARLAPESRLGFRAAPLLQAFALGLHPTPGEPAAPRGEQPAV